MSEQVGPQFNIGDSVFLARFEASEAYVTCPDCGGTGRLRMTFHDDTTVSIECRNCAAGYDPPTGRIKVYERKPSAMSIQVSGLEVGVDGVRYRLGGGLNWNYIGDACDVFATREEAEARGQQLADAATAEELQRVYRKERDTRTWAWNASYHRKAIKEAHRQIEYHTAKLTVAAIKAKEKTA